MWNKQRTSEYQERSTEMDVANPGMRRSVLLEVEPSETESRQTTPGATHRHDILARVIGLLLCLIGVAIIGAVIYLAWELYKDPNLAKLPTPAAGQSGVPGADGRSTFMRRTFQLGAVAGL